MEQQKEARKKRLTRISSKLDSLALPSPSSGKSRPKEEVPKTRVEEKESPVNPKAGVGMGVGMGMGGVSSPTSSGSPGSRHEATSVAAKTARRWS